MMFMKLHQSERPRAVLAVALAAVALSFSTAAIAADAGMRVVRDPVTGQLRAPSHEEFKALQEQSQRDAAAARATGRTAASQPAAVPQVLQDGSVTMELDESHWSYSVATRKADGSLDLNCVTGDKAARRLMTGAKTQVSKSGKQSLQVKEHGHVHK